MMKLPVKRCSQQWEYKHGLEDEITDLKSEIYYLKQEIAYGNSREYEDNLRADTFGHS